MNTEIEQLRPEIKLDPTRLAQATRDAFMDEVWKDFREGFKIGAGGSGGGAHRTNESSSPARNSITGDTRPRPSAENNRDKSREPRSDASEYQIPVTPQEFSPRHEHAPIKPPHEAVPNQQQNTCRLRFSW